MKSRRAAAPARANVATTADRALGARLRTRRLELRLSLREVAAGVGVSAQQIDNYEKGVDRVAATRLPAFARVLLVADYGWFFGA